VVTCEIWVIIGVELFYGLLGSFGGSHLVVWVASFKEASKFDVGILGESLLCHGQEFADPIEGIFASASVAIDVVLYPSSCLVKASVGEVGSNQSALPTFPLVGFSGPPSEPDVRLPPHPALPEPMPSRYDAFSSILAHGEGIAAPR
jgi:hypothetical protein